MLPCPNDNDNGGGDDQGPSSWKLRDDLQDYQTISEYDGGCVIKYPRSKPKRFRLQDSTHGYTSDTHIRLQE